MHSIFVLLKAKCDHFVTNLKGIRTSLGMWAGVLVFREGAVERIFYERVGISFGGIGV
jgi:hypothetical protein